MLPARINRQGAPKFTQAIGQQICDEIATGLTISQVCNDPDMPAQRTVYHWLAGRGLTEAEKEWFREEFEAAQLCRADVYIEQCMDIADDISDDWTQVETKQGNVLDRLNTEAIQRSKLRIETRQWAASRLNPEKYGLKQTLTVKREPLKPAARNQRIAELIQKCLPSKPAANEEMSNEQQNDSRDADAEQGH